MCTSQKPPYLSLKKQAHALYNSYLALLGMWAIHRTTGLNLPDTWRWPLWMRAQCSWWNCVRPFCDNSDSYFIIKTQYGSVMNTSVFLPYLPLSHATCHCSKYNCHTISATDLLFWSSSAWGTLFWQMTAEDLYVMSVPGLSFLGYRWKSRTRWPLRLFSGSNVEVNGLQVCTSVPAPWVLGLGSSWFPEMVPFCAFRAGLGVKRGVTVQADAPLILGCIVKQISVKKNYRFLWIHDN